MKIYSISEAIGFLAQEYGAENMPTSEETLRRAIRTKKLKVQEDGDPGRKGYSILEEDLRKYGENRLKRAINRKNRAPSISSSYGVVETAPKREKIKPVSFPELFTQYTDGNLSSTDYYKALFSERTKWEKIMHDKQLQLAQLNAKMVLLQNEIESCQSAIDAYSDGISKYRP